MEAFSINGKEEREGWKEGRKVSSSLSFLIVRGEEEGRRVVRGPFGDKERGRKEEESS